MIRWIAIGLVILLSALRVIATGGLAQEAQSDSPQSGGISPAIVEKLVKYTIIAIDQGNQTGNYSVLRELGTPKFQMTTSSAKLSDVFAPLRRMKLDMSALTLLKPIFTKPPVVENGQLRIFGYFPTTPIQINFTMTYAQQNGQPRLAGVSITPVNVTGSAEGIAPEPMEKSDQQ